MAGDKLSKFKFYSLGIVAANKPLDSHEIEVVPIEDFPMLDGEATDNVYKYKAKFKDAENSNFSTELKTTVSVPATWIPISNPNRKTSPDVRRGATVMLYSFGDSDKLWWNTLKDDARKLETVCYSFSNNRDENKPDTPDTTYFFEVSTHKKTVHLHTSNNDGEPFAYDIQINAKDGFVVIADDVGNYIELKSDDKRIRLKNSVDSSITIEGTVATIKALTTIVDSTKTIIKGDVQVDGTIHSNKAISSDAGISGTGNISSGGNISAVGTIIDGGGNSNHHSH